MHRFTIVNRVACSSLMGYPVHRYIVSISVRQRISPLNHATYYMHNFGYDLLPRLWHSYLILGVWILLNILLIRRLARRYQFNFS